MSLSPDWLNKARDDYLKAKQLSEKESVKDPETEPFKSKYQARKLFDNILTEVKQFTVNDDDKYSPVKLITILINLEIGVIDQDTEELSSSEAHLLEARRLCNQWYTNDQSIILFRLNILNQLSYLWTMRANYEKALEYLKEAETNYNEWRKAMETKHDEKDETKLVIEFLDCFTNNPQSVTNQESEAEKNTENTFTQSLYFLAQVYEKISDHSTSARYCYQTLKRQYDYNNYVAISWSLNTATLAQYYAGINHFKIGGHLLVAARFILNSCSPDQEDEQEKLKASQADLARIGVKFYLMLLEASKIALICPENRHQSDESPQKLAEHILIPEEIISNEAKSIRTSYITNFNEAKEVFIQAQSWLNDAKAYYTLDEHASDYVECVQDHSKLYRLLTSFDDDIERKCKMHKRRVDLLEAILSAINEKIFQAQARQMHFECGEIYTEMFEIKSETKSNSGAVAKKINQLIVKAIEHYQKFIDSFKDSHGNLPSRLDDDMVRPIIIALFSIGRCYTKILSRDPKEQVENWKKCEDYYTQVKGYGENNPDHRPLAQEEINLIEEMLALIPKRVAMLLNAPLLS